MKKCNTCNTELDKSEYFKLNGSPDGLMKICKTCYTNKYKGDIYSTIKVCSSCEMELSLNNFYRDKNQKDGRKPVCKTCHKELWNGGNKVILIEDSNLQEDEIEMTKEVLRGLGYEYGNPNRTVYQQFLERHPQLKK